MAPANNTPSSESDASMRARLVESLSSSFPGSALSLALHTMTSDPQEAEDPLSSSCFAELRLDRGGPSDDDDDDDIEDDDLTSLAWLQEGDLLKSINGPDDAFRSIIDDVPKENGFIANNVHPPHVPYNPQKHVTSKPPYSFSCLIFMAIEESPLKRLPVKEIYGWMMLRFPYFENAPTGWKNSVRHNLSLNKCFKKVDKDKASSIGKGSLWMIDPDFRPNLLQALRKTPYHPYHQLQMLSNCTLPTTDMAVLPSGAQMFPQNAADNINKPSPHLFPYLSKRLAQSGKLNIDSDIDVANTLMSLKRSYEDRRPLRCRNGWSERGARSRSPSPPEFGSEREKKQLKERYKAMVAKASIVCTEPPTDDHSYSMTSAILRESLEMSREFRSPTSSIDAEYEFGGQTPPTDERADNNNSCSDCSDYEESEGEDAKPARHSLRVTLPAFGRPKTAKRRRVSSEDEQIKIEEGADALMNLAGICTASIPLRAISPTVPTPGLVPFEPTTMVTPQIKAKT